MRRFLVAIVLIAVLSILCQEVGPLPYGSPRYANMIQRPHWHVMETPECPNGYMCAYGMWYPEVTVWRYPLWVFGVSTDDERGGVLHFREYPDHPCSQHCFEDLPILYTAEVIYVPFYGEHDYTPDEVPLTYIPPGKYVVTSPSFHIYYNDKYWYFRDDGTGPQKMSAHLETDKTEYGREDPAATLSLQVIDKSTGAAIQVDSISGTITLPDATTKTVKTEDWSWNDEETSYVYCWNFANDAGECADPKEGFYSAGMYIKKKYYQDTTAGCDFAVCYHIELDLDFDKDPPEYALGEPVEMTVLARDENGEPVNATVKSVVQLPDGLMITDLEWILTAPGTYRASYIPELEGEYQIAIRLEEDIKCYLEEASGTFYVGCDDADIHLEIGDAVIDEPVEFVLTVTDCDGNPLPGGEIESVLCLPDGSSLSLCWTDQNDGTYTAEYTPSVLGWHQLCGTVIIIDETGCYKGFFEGSFTVTEKKLPDLIIRNEDITVTPDPQIGEDVLISVTVWNMGEADAGEFYVLVLINGEKFASKLVETLAAHESITLTFEWKVKYTGKYVITAIADAGEEIE
jgi:hypothetical protein